jgi:hypothetical protein
MQDRIRKYVLKEYDNLVRRKNLHIAPEFQYICVAYNEMNLLFSTAHQEISEGKTIQYEESEHRPMQQCLPLNLNLANIAEDFKDPLGTIETLKGADPVYCTKQFVAAMRAVLDSFDGDTTGDVLSVQIGDKEQSFESWPSFHDFYQLVRKERKPSDEDGEDGSPKEKLKEICHKYTRTDADGKTSVLDALERALQDSINDKGRKILAECILQQNGKSFLKRSSWEGKLNN